MPAYYNEIDPTAASWLRELIKQRHIADGEVDERDIRDIEPNDLRLFTQCHFFAGIGVWSYALRNAGWSDDRQVWTGSCPCQPFSAAGKGAGTNDERHLWPAFYHLIQECRPRVVFGEQVEAAIKHGWLDLVQDDLEGVGYSVGAASFPAASLGAPHIRQRLYFVAERANTEGERFREARPTFGRQAERIGERRDAGECADTQLSNRRTQLEINGNAHGRNGLGRSSNADGRDSATGECLYPYSERGCGGTAGGEDAGDVRQPSEIALYASRIGATRGFWADCDWWYGRDGKYRPIEPGVLPLAHGSPARVGRLRGYGNAIVAPQAQAFIEAYIEITS